jgi:NDP-sugar pyrophosphorylase family protein
VAQGIREVVICAGHLGEQIEAFAGDGSRFGCSIVYSHDGNTLLGTGGALRRALPLLGECFFVMYGDSYLTANPVDAWNAFVASGRPALMSIYRNEGRWDASNVEMRNGEIVCYRKNARTPEMRYIDYGLSILRADTIRNWPDGAQFDLADVLSHLAAARQLAAHEVHERFFEIGSYEGLSMTEEHIAAMMTLSGEMR